VIRRVKFTNYFLTTRARPDRSRIEDRWIESAIRRPVRRVTQYGETVHNAFFDRSYREQ